MGLLIHEGQLTYADSGLHLWADMGAWWLRETGLPLPLGGNVVRRDLGRDIIDQVARDLRASIEYALAAPRLRPWPMRNSTTAASATSGPTRSSGCT